MRGDVRFGRVRFVWAWSGRIGELGAGLAWLGEVRQGQVWQLRHGEIRFGKVS